MKLLISLCLLLFSSKLTAAAAALYLLQLNLLVRTEPDAVNEAKTLWLRRDDEINGTAKFNEIADKKNDFMKSGQ